MLLLVTLLMKMEVESTGAFELLRLFLHPLHKTDDEFSVLGWGSKIVQDFFR